MRNTDKKTAWLIYLLENCIFAYDQLCEIKKKLDEEYAKNKRNVFSSDKGIEYFGPINRIYQDYLIIRVAGLFDCYVYPRPPKIDKVVSFAKVFPKNKIYKKARGQEIIGYLIEKRNNFVAHPNIDYFIKSLPITDEICDSDLREILLGLKKLVVI